jgi:hypothetical protein
MLEEDFENQMNVKGEKRGGIEKNLRSKDSVEHHSPKKNKVGWPHNETQQLCWKCNGGKS